MKNKIGALVKLIANKYYDRKLINNTNVLNKDIAPLFKWSTSTQSIDYLYLKKSLLGLRFDKEDNVLDLGSGKGRMLLYLDYFYRNEKIKFYGAEINEEAYLISLGLCNTNKSNIYNTDALKNNFIQKHKINKILLFNPFDKTIFQKFLEYIIEKVNYKLEFLYVNISEEQIEILQKSNITHKIINLNYPLLGINNKANAFGSINE